MSIIKKSISDEAEKALIAKYGKEWDKSVIKECYEMSYPSIYYGVVFYSSERDEIIITSCEIDNLIEGCQLEEGDVLIAIPPSRLESYIDEDNNRLAMDSEEAKIFFTSEELEAINNLEKITLKSVFDVLDLNIKDLSNKWINFYQQLFLDEHYA